MAIIVDVRSVVDELEISFSSHLLLFGKNNNHVLLRITTNSNLSFKKHISNLCKKVSAKLNHLASISGYMNLPKRKIIMKLIWMFYSRTLNNRINSIHERAL